MKTKQLLIGVGVIALSGVLFSIKPFSNVNAQEVETPTTDMVDVSSWQSNLTAQDYQTLKEAGVKAVTIKASEGTDYINPYLSQQMGYAQDAGLSVNFYHFVHFTSIESAKQEAENFIKAVQSVTSRKDGVMVADFESSELSSLSKSQNDADLAAFDDVLNQNGYNKTDLYVSASWVGSLIDTNSANKGWIASWPEQPSGDPYPDANAWQYASDHRFSGIDENLDVSLLNNDYYLGGTGNNSTTSSFSSSTGNETAATSSSSDPQASSSSTSEPAKTSSSGSSTTTGSTSSSQNPGKSVIITSPNNKPTSSSSAGSSYSAARSNSMRLIWREPMNWHPYYAVKGARYSKHLGIRYGNNSDLPNVTWATIEHEKLQVKQSGKTLIYYHVKSLDGKYSGWIWRGYLIPGYNPDNK